MGLASGLAMSDRKFTGGSISFDVALTGIAPGSAAEAVFYYDPVSRNYASAGIGGGGAFTIRHWTNNGWVFHASAGDRGSLVPGHTYHIEVTVRGSRVRLLVDGVEVVGAALPFSLPPSQAGLFCFDSNTQVITNYRVESKRGRVFVVMQFSAPFNDIFEEVLSRVCADDEFRLDAHRADETYGPGLIIADVVRDIAEAEFVIADITPANPNVFYELGYAHAINKPVILLADRALEKLPFDVSAFRVLFYENTIAGKRRFEDGLRQHIRAVLEKGALGGDVLGTPPNRAAAG